MNASDRARAAILEEDGGPWFACRWAPALFLHYAVPAAALAPHVPFDLDLFEGQAHVSLVAFEEHAAPKGSGGGLLTFLARAFAAHSFLNVRAYVRHGGESGIHFLSEWIPNRLGLFLGPRVYGLPYRRGKPAYSHDLVRGPIEGRVDALDAGASIEWGAPPPADLAPAPAPAGSLDAFLVERYAAFTLRRGVRRRFRVWHAPWPIASVEARVTDRGLLAAAGPWASSARFLSAAWSPGVPVVWVGKPRRF